MSVLHVRLCREEKWVRDTCILKITQMMLRFGSQEEPVLTQVSFCLSQVTYIYFGPARQSNTESACLSSNAGSATSSWETWTNCPAPRKSNSCCYHRCCFHYSSPLYCLQNLPWEGKVGPGHTGQQGSGNDSVPHVPRVPPCTCLPQSIPTRSRSGRHLQ